jgi:hypothetical protein
VYVSIIASRKVRERRTFMSHAVIAFILLISGSLAVFGQKNSDEAKNPQYARIPSEEVLVAIAAQPNCPVRIEEAEFLLNGEGHGYLIKYRARNMSTRQVTFFSVVAWNATGSGGTVGNPLFTSNLVLSPGDTVDSQKEGKDYEVVPMSDAIREKLRPRNEMKTFYILLVDKVVFADGTTYEGKKLSESLTSFLDKGDY